MAHDQSAGSGLESHLRKMILTNANAEGDAPSGIGRPGQHVLDMADQRNVYGSFGKTNDEVTGHALATSIDGTEGHTRQAPQKTTRKRPNQAQRRQMNSQLSIPIDTRPQHPQPSQRNGPASGGYNLRPHHSHHYNHAPGFDSGARDTRFPPRSWSNYNHGHNYGPPAAHQQPPAHQVLRHDTSFPPQDRMHPRHGPAHGNGALNRQQHKAEMISRQAAFLDNISYGVVANSEIDVSEIAEKESFRQYIEDIGRNVIAKYEQEQNPAHDFRPESVELKCFGSLSSGFATKASDMDLGLLSPLSTTQPDAADSPIPRLLERALLDAGLGARLLSRTRVPIIKLCQSPPEKLRQGLLEERKKWESGLGNELAEDDEHDDGGAQHHDEEPSDPVMQDDTAAAEFELPTGENGETQRFHLKQGAKSLLAYYNLAKRVLRKAGGRDVSMLNYRDFSAHDWAILDGICQAFVRGLTDKNLEQRLSDYPSLRFETGYPPASHRSLAGVFSQIEGERILQAWDAWPAKQEIRISSGHAEQVLRTWQETQRKTTFAVDPISYTKELQYALDKLKRLPFLQLVTLEQSQQESPSQYHARTKLILQNIHTPGHELSSAASKAVLEYYISGIFHQEIRDAVKNAFATASVAWDIETLGRRHKSLHLAREFERALSKGLYDDGCINEVKEYIALLREPLREFKAQDGLSHFFVARPDDDGALLSTIRALQDPHSLEPNQNRDRYHDRLEFPKTGAGIQCDINFSAHLALQNTLLLRCYSHSDPRVKPMVLFVKHWAKVRDINSGYRGTLSSYGYVLMVLHYLVNIAQPFVCPNLQKLAQPPPPNLTPAEIESTVLCKGYDVQFWRNEAQILQLARDNQLNHNSETLGQLLRGFFEYYAHSGPLLGHGSCRGFDWGRDVLSLRTHGGLLTKQEKGWTGARTVLEVQNPAPNSHEQDAQTASNDTGLATPKPTGSNPQQKPTSKQGGVKEVRHRYLFAIEDPFELSHNVARTVTHNGIVSIRDEFRRAWAILQAAGRDQPHDDLLKHANESEEGPSPLSQLLEELHGPGGVGA